MSSPPAAPNMEASPEAEPTPSVEVPDNLATAEAFQKFNEDYPESDESSDYSDEEGEAGGLKDIFGDGTVMKTKMTQGTGWETPKDFGKCVVELKMGETDPVETTFVVDEGEAPVVGGPADCLDCVVKTMRAEETADVEIDGAKAFSVTLKSFEKIPNAHDFTGETAAADKTDHVAALKASGNGWFKKGALDRAKRRYEAAVSFARVQMCL